MELNSQNNNEEFENQVNVSEIFRLIYIKKYFVFLATLFVTICSLFVALIYPEKYTSSALLKVSNIEGDQVSSSALSQYAGLAGLAGISLGNSSAEKSNYAVELMSSYLFAEHILEFPEQAPLLMAAKSYDPISRSVIIDKKIYDPDSNKWIRKAPKNRNQIPSYVEVFDETISKDLSISLNSKTGFIKIQFTHISPIFARDFINLVVREANILSREYDLNESNKALEYLEMKLKQTNQAEVKDSINNLIEVQLKTQMLANIKEDYLVSFIDYPFIPEEYSPSKSVIIIFGFLLGIFSSIFLIILQNRISR